MSHQTNTSSPRHYIVVVHGIGEQRHNEATVEVVNRFATARAKDKPQRPYAGLLPASLSSLSMRRKGGGQGWSEYRGIPVDPSCVSELFDGTRATETSGENFRFVDVRWADILQSHQDSFGASTKQWTASLLARLEKPYTPENWSEAWVLPLLKEIEQTLLPIQNLLKRYSHEIETSVFRNVIGDIHLYGDYARTRGQAVRRFHTMLDEIHLRDYVQWCRFERTCGEEEYVPPVYTVIAHSLGSVLSFDALLYAFAKESIRDGSDHHISGAIPFPSYTEPEESDVTSWMGLVAELAKEPPRNGLPKAADNWARLSACYPQFCRWHGGAPPDQQLSPTGSEIPLLLWRNHVKHFISLGSPIDKFLALWHHNYRHMGLSHHDFLPAWSEEWLDVTGAPRITHYNLCDEQDPVGHHLDLAHECPAYRKVFDTSVPVTYRDVVFRRYPVPGLAHVQYWKDQALFDRLLGEIIDKTPLAPGSPTGASHLGQFVAKAFIEVDGVYNTALVWAYIRIPLIAAVISGLLMSYGWIGWRYDGFSLSYGLSLLAGLLLWISPKPLQAYRKEAGPEYSARHNWFMRRLMPWKPRRGLCARLVAGAVAWRRILIWLNLHPNQAFEVDDAVIRNIRLSLKTAGNFRKLFWPRIAWGIAVFLAASAATWIGRAHLLDARNGAIGPPLWYVGALGLLTVSTVYLGVMMYVGHCFRSMKNQMVQARTRG